MAATTTNTNTTNTTTIEVEKLDLDTDIDSINFYQAWKSTFPSTHALYSYNAKEDPETALSVIQDAYAFTMAWLPRSAMQKLARMPYGGPSSLLLKGFPIGEVPPTPIKKQIHTKDTEIKDNKTDQAWAAASTHVPVAETWLLGVARLLGTLQSPPWTTGRGGLVNDMIPVQTGKFNEMKDLRMHRDFPRQMNIGPKESQFFVLFAVRGDPDHNAKTVVCDSKALLERIDPKDRLLLQQFPIQVQKQPDPDKPPLDFGDPLYVIQDDDILNLVFVPYQIITSPHGGQPVLDAYYRVEQIAWDCGDHIDLQQGDMLILNNCRLVHGRTAYKPKLDGTDRWLVKCYVNNLLWGHPGIGSNDIGQASFPNFSP